MLKKCYEILRQNKKDIDDIELEYCYDCLLELLQYNYFVVLKFCKEHNIKSITDIGTAYSTQGALFNYFDIEYNAINNELFERQDKHVKFKSYQNGFYGKDKIKTDKNSLGVACLSIGWPCYVSDEEAENQYKQLAKDFNSVLVYVPDNKITKHFKYNKQISDNWIYCSNTKGI